MNAPLRFLSIVSISAILSGCVVVAGDIDEWDRDDYRSDWQKIERENRANIANLTLGATYASVVTVMGQADFSEAFETGGHQYQILFYRTHRVDSDGETTKDETTPLVFKDQQLIGWGQDALQRIPM